MKQFGAFIKAIRIDKGLTLRDFCRKANFDPSNWSKIERSLLPPPKSKMVLEELAGILEITKGSEEWHTMFDLAIASHVPTELIGDEDVVHHLPVFFRTLRGDKPSREELHALIEKIKHG